MAARGGATARLGCVLLAGTMLMGLLGLPGLLGASAAAAALDGEPAPERPEKPLIEDPAGDVDLYVALQPLPAPLPSSDAVDLVAAWFHSATEADVSVSMQVASLADLETLRQDPSYSAQYAVTFSVDGREDLEGFFHAQAWFAGKEYRPNAGDAAWRFALLDPATETWLDAVGEVDVPTATITLTLPRDALDATHPGATLTHVRAHAWATYTPALTALLAVADDWADPDAPADAFAFPGAEPAEEVATQGADANAAPPPRAVPGLSGPGVLLAGLGGGALAARAAGRRRQD